MRMKRVSAVICSLLSAGLLLIGCSRLPAVTLDELLAEVNSAHQAIDNDGLRSKFILRQPVAENGEPISIFDRYSYYAGELEPYDPDLVLTQEQVIEDVTYLFDALYACYGNYDQMGGQAAFDAAEQAVLEECRQVDSLRAEDFQQLLIPHFAFIQDGHFQIQNQLVCPSWYPFFFREVDFYEVDGQYITADHKTVASVDGCDDLTELFKRSISPEGEIVWYPVLLRDSTTCNETLTVHYTDGSTQELQSTPCDYSDQMDQLLSMDQKAIPDVRYDGDIPVLQVNGMQGGRSPSLAGTKLSWKARRPWQIPKSAFWICALIPEESWNCLPIGSTPMQKHRFRQTLFSEMLLPETRCLIRGTSGLRMTIFW